MYPVVLSTAPPRTCDKIECSIPLSLPARKPELRRPAAAVPRSRPSWRRAAPRPRGSIARALRVAFIYRRACLPAFYSLFLRASRTLDTRVPRLVVSLMNTRSTNGRLDAETLGRHIQLMSKRAEVRQLKRRPCDAMNTGPCLIDAAKVPT